MSDKNQDITKLYEPGTYEHAAAVASAAKKPLRHVGQLDYFAGSVDLSRGNVPEMYMGSSWDLLNGPWDVRILINGASKSDVILALEMALDSVKQSDSEVACGIGSAAKPERHPLIDAVAALAPEPKQPEPATEIQF